MMHFKNILKRLQYSGVEKWAALILRETVIITYCVEKTLHMQIMKYEVHHENWGKNKWWTQILSIVFYMYFDPFNFHGPI